MGTESLSSEASEVSEVAETSEMSTMAAGVSLRGALTLGTDTTE